MTTCYGFNGDKQKIQVYSKADLDEILNGIYTKTEADDKFRTIADSYTKTEADNKYRTISDSYTKTQVDTNIQTAIGSVYSKSDFIIISHTFNSLAINTSGFYSDDISPTVLDPNSEYIMLSCYQLVSKPSPNAIHEFMSAGAWYISDQGANIPRVNIYLDTSHSEHYYSADFSGFNNSDSVANVTVYAILLEVDEEES